MIELIEGNILQSKENVICHSVNHRGVMGAGLAKEIATMYPLIASEFEQYKNICSALPYKSVKRNGVVAWYKVDENKRVASIFGQDGFAGGRRNTDYVSFGNGFCTVAEISEMSNWSVAIPYGIGCGLGGGDWKVVLTIIEDCFKYFPSVDVRIYKYKKDYKRYE